LDTFLKSFGSYSCTSLQSLAAKPFFLSAEQELLRSLCRLKKKMGLTCKRIFASIRAKTAVLKCTRVCKMSCCFEITFQKAFYVKLKFNFCTTALAPIAVKILWDGLFQHIPKIETKSGKWLQKKLK
jgi:hypothetical protein